MTFARFMLVPVLAVVVLSGCAGRDAPAAQPAESSPAAVAASAVPTPTPTADATTLTNVGLGDLEIGKPVPDDTDLLQWGDFCGYGTDQWHAPGATFDDLGAIGVTPADWAKDGALEAIWIWTDAISTPEGIHEGSTLAEVEAAYPDAQFAAGFGTTNLYVVHGEGTNLVFEVVKPDIELADDNHVVPDTVRWMYLRTADAEIKTIDGTGPPASCD